MKEVRKDITGGHLSVFTRKTADDETFIKSLSIICKSIVGIDASQRYPISKCQDNPTGLHTKWEYDTNKRKLKVDIKDHVKMRIWSCLSTRNKYQNAKGSFFSSGKQQKI